MTDPDAPVGDRTGASLDIIVLEGKILLVFSAAEDNRELSAEIEMSIEEAADFRKSVSDAIVEARFQRDGRPPKRKDPGG